MEEAHKIFIEQGPNDSKQREAKVLLKLTKAFETKAGIPSDIILQKHVMIKQLAESVTQMIKSIDLTKRPKPVKVTLEEILAKYESAIRSQPFAKPAEAKVRIEKIE